MVAVAAVVAPGVLLDGVGRLVAGEIVSTLREESGWSIDAATSTVATAAARPTVR